MFRNLFKQKNIQIALSNVQTVILNNQQQIVNSMENIEASVSIYCETSCFIFNLNKYFLTDCIKTGDDGSITTFDGVEDIHQKGRGVRLSHDW